MQPKNMYSCLLIANTLRWYFIFSRLLCNGPSRDYAPINVKPEGGGEGGLLDQLRCLRYFRAAMFSSLEENVQT